MTAKQLAWTAGVLLFAIVGGIVAFGLTRADESKTPTALDPAQGDVHAQQACRAFARFERLVNENGPSDDVYDALDDLKAATQRAADADPRWRSLDAGADSLELAFKQDDARAARQGLDVTRAQCAFTK